MKKKHKWYLVAAGIALLMLSLVWNTISVGWVSGRVLEEGTNKPLADVIVVVLWRGLAFHGSSCFHVETGVTDKDGYYKISAWFISKRGFMLSNKYHSVLVYKEGYERSKKIEEEAIHLVPFTVTREERLEYLLKIASHGCFSEKLKKLIPYNQALYEEAKTIAVTESENKLADRVRYYLHVVRYGWDEADKRK